MSAIDILLFNSCMDHCKGAMGHEVYPVKQYMFRIHRYQVKGEYVMKLDFRDKISQKRRLDSWLGLWTIG